MAYETVDRQVLYAGTKVRLEVHHLSDPETGKTARREVCVHPGAVLILPILQDGPDPTLLFVRNRRYAVGKTLLELPAGTLEPKEPPMDCAGRELQEETGYLASRMRNLCSFYTSPGLLSEVMHCFVASGLEPTRQATEEGEELEVVQMSLTEAVRLIRGGGIVDAKTIAALLTYERFHHARSDPMGGDDAEGLIRLT